MSGELVSGGMRRLGRRATAVIAVATALCLTATACDPPPNPSPGGSARSCTVGVVGDSLTVGSGPFWREAFESRGCRLSFVNARGGRFTSEGVEVIRNLARVGWLPDVLVVALGTNDQIDPRYFAPQVQEVMRLAGDRPVVWVNIDKPWVEVTLNLALKLGKILYPNLWVYDWNKFADRFPQIRLPDKIHLTEGGYRLRAALIARYVAGR